jgi:hypothetical protein
MCPESVGDFCDTFFSSMFVETADIELSQGIKENTVTLE